MSQRVPVTPVDAAEIGDYDHETDVLIIGYGCAGAAAALDAIEAGSDVILLERQSGGGGSSALSGGEVYLGGGTPIQHYRWLVDHGVPFKPSLWDSPTWVPPTDDGLGRNQTDTADNRLCV